MAVLSSKFYEQFKSKKHCIENTLIENMFYPLQCSSKTITNWTNFRVRKTVSMTKAVNFIITYH